MDDDDIEVDIPGVGRMSGREALEYLEKERLKKKAESVFGSFVGPIWAAWVKNGNLSSSDIRKLFTFITSQKNHIERLEKNV